MRRLSFLLILALIVSLFPFCGAEQPSFPVTVIDAAGREVTIEACPESIVSGYYISTSMLMALGVKGKLVGIEAKANKRSIYKLASPELIELPNVGSVKEFNLEATVALTPDVVILPLKLKDKAETLSSMGINTVLINAESYDDLLATIALLAQITGADETALLNYISEKQAFMEEKTASLTQKRVYLAGNSSFLMTGGMNMYQNTLLAMAGGENVAADIEDSYWANISYEQLLAYNPEVIIMAADADYTAEDILSDPMLQDVTAVKNGEVYAMPSAIEAWDSPVPATVLGSLWIMNKLYPETYTEEELFAEIVSFYETFYGFTVTKELLNK